MLFPALGITMAVWLLMAPLLGIESGIRAELAIAAGCAGAILAALSVWFRQMGFALAALGIVVGFANFGLVVSLGGLANMATCGCAFVVAGMAPQPTMTRVTAAARGRVPLATEAAEDTLATAPIPVGA